MSGPLRIEGTPALAREGDRAALAATLVVDAPIVFVPGLYVQVEHAPGSYLAADSREGYYIGWLPRGRYRASFLLPDLLPAGERRFRIDLWHRDGMRDVSPGHVDGAIAVPAPRGGLAQPHGWAFEAIAPTPALGSLAWRKGHEDWFFRHFDHAATTIMGYLLKDSPLLKGRILDVGCGDGITDLGVALRTKCESLVGIDPFRGYERLSQVIAENHLPADVVPPNLRFQAEDANHLPFADDSFDVLISWGSVEHIAGGYHRALEEMRRVLRPEGLLFIHPGLYYSNYGHHLGEFSSEPFFHLKHPEAEVKRIVMETPPRYMDRAGEFSSPAQYWQWYKELNPITVAGFERELRELGFQPWRVAIRTEGVIEYTPEIEHYPMQDLATCELYLSCVNRKKRA